MRRSIGTGVEFCTVNVNQIVTEIV